MHQQIIELFGILFQEPVTAATDLLTASVCYYAFFTLRSLKTKQVANQFFSYYFLFLAIGTTCAAFFSHAILHLTGYNWKTLGWTFIGMAIYFMENSALAFYQQETKSNRWNWLSAAFKIQYLLFLTLLLYPSTRLFKVVQINTALGILLITFPTFVYLFRKTKKSGYRKVIVAFCMSFVMALVFNIEITFHKYFNYHDFSHVLMAFSCFFIVFRVESNWR